MDIESTSEDYNRAASTRMDEEHRESLCSLERGSRRRLSLSNKVSLINVMDLEGRESRESICQHLLRDSKRFSDFRNSAASGEVYDYKTDEDETFHRKSHYHVQHECSCQQNCNTLSCICYLSPKEICVIGNCCPECIHLKNKFLREAKGYLSPSEKDKQNNLQATISKKNVHYLKLAQQRERGNEEIVFCTCKKSRCCKKYCLCFEQGRLCSKYCICVECLNSVHQEDEEQRRWQRYAVYIPEHTRQEEEIHHLDHNVEQFIEVEASHVTPQMQFEPFNFKNCMDTL